MKYLKTFERKIITEVDLSYKKLTKLPELPDTLKELYCSNNQLNKLPDLPDTLQVLYCNNNQLTKLPDLPDTLIELSCSGNQLPYEDLDGYRKWFEETYPEKIAAKQYNL